MRNGDIINNKGYIITIKDAVVNDDIIEQLISSPSDSYQVQNLPLIFYKNREQFEKIDTAIRPGFRMNGFVILNFDKKEKAQLISFVKTSLSNDDFIKQILKEREIIDADKISFNTLEKLIEEINEILALELKKGDIFEISEIKVMTKEEKMINNIPSIRLIISSPEDVSEDSERARGFINEIKRGRLYSKKFTIQCETYNWDDKPVKNKFGALQDFLKNSIHKYNIYVFILWKVFSLKNEDAESKIEGQLKEIIDNYQNIEPDKSWLMFYFKNSDIPMDEIKLEHIYKQFPKIDKFKSLASKKGISLIYNEEKEFKNKFINYIKDILNKIESQSQIKEIFDEKREKEFKDKYKIAIEKDIQDYQNKDELKIYTELNALDSKNMPLGHLTETLHSLTSQSGKPIAIIGDFGSGKTTFTRYYEYKKKCEWLESPDKSNPILFLDMNDYSKKKYKMTMIKWVMDYIEQKIKFDIKKVELENLLKEKKLFLIFDGLDEVANIPGEDAINKAMRKIKQLSHMGSPVVITSRKTFIESEVDQRNLKNFTRIYIDKLSDHQIMDFIRKRIPENQTKFSEFIFEKEKRAQKNEGNDYNIVEMIKKPLFLYMMINAHQQGFLKDINNPSDLYEIFTDDWIAKEIKKEETYIQKKEEMKQIIQELAFRMFIENQFSYSYDELKKNIYDILNKINKKNNSDYNAILNDITNASFLVRDKVGKNSFAFLHRSFIEYFVAYKLSLELKDKNTNDLSKRILYEEIFEFIAGILTEKNGKDKYLINILGESQFPFEARVNVIPPLRKQRNRKAIKSLLSVLTDVDSGHPLLRFVCGYTLSIFLGMTEFQEELKSQDLKNLLAEAYKKETNALIKIRMALLLTEGKYMKYEELNPDYNFFASTVNEILDPSGIKEAYEKVLKVNREHPIVIEETIRVLTIYVMFNPEKSNFKNTLLRYIFNYQHKNERIRRICLWSISKLGLLEAKDKKRETLEIKKKSKNMVEKSLKDADSSVLEMAKHIIAKYPKQFIKDYEEN